MHIIMGFYETFYLVKAVHFVPSAEGVTSNNIKKINGEWYYFKFNKELQVNFDHKFTDLSCIIHTIDENKIDDFEKYNVDLITEDCSLKGLRLDWYILIQGFSSLDMSLYTSIYKITNNDNLVINKESIKKCRINFKNGIILEKMEHIEKEIERLKLEHNELKNTLTY